MIPPQPGRVYKVAVAFSTRDSSSLKPASLDWLVKDETARVMVPAVFALSFGGIPVSGEYVQLDNRPWPINPNGSLQLDLDPGPHQLSVPTIVDLDPGKRAVFDGWSDENPAYRASCLSYCGIGPVRRINIGGDLNLRVIYRIEYLLTVIDEDATASEAGWYSSGSIANVSTPISTGGLMPRVFDHWSGDLSGKSSFASILMDGPKTAIAVRRLDLTPLGAVFSLVLTGSLVGLIVYRNKRRPLRRIDVRQEWEGIQGGPAFSTRFCVLCVNQILTNDRFCRNCGASQQ